MKSINDIRRDNLRDIIDRDFNKTQSRLAERLECQPNLVSRWVKGVKTIGDSVARKIEKAANKPTFWLDVDHYLTMVAGVEQEEEHSEIGVVVASNLQRWMESNRAFSSQHKVAEAAGVSQATINRLLRNEASITLNNLAAIAAVFGRRAYELIVPPGDTGMIKYDHSRYALLPETEKAKIESFIDFILAQNDK